MEVFDHAYEDYQEELSKDKICPECEQYFDGGGMYCSRECFILSEN